MDGLDATTPCFDDNETGAVTATGTGVVVAAFNKTLCCCCWMCFRTISAPRRILLSFVELVLFVTTVSTEVDRVVP